MCVRWRGGRGGPGSRFSLDRFERKTTHLYSEGVTWVISHEKQVKGGSRVLFNLIKSRCLSCSISKYILLMDVPCV